MSNGLFREEALNAQRTEWIGSTRLDAPRLAWIYVVIGLLTITVLLAFLFGGHYRRHERAVGVLVPSRGLLTVSPSASGVVLNVRVHDGEIVHVGQVLVEISTERVSASVGAVGAGVAAQLAVKKQHLVADVANEDAAAALQERELHNQLSLKLQQHSQLEEQVDIQEQRATSAMTLYEQWLRAERSGVVSKTQLLQQHDTALQNLAEVKELQRQATGIRQEIAEVQGEIARLPSLTSAKRNDTERQLADVAQSLAENSASQTIVLRASDDGTVMNLLIHPGQSVVAQQTLLTLLPNNSDLLAEVWLSPKAIGFVAAGAPVVIRYEAYPFQKFGQHMGRVSNISQGAVAGREVARILGEGPPESQYRVEVALNEQTIPAYGKRQSLRPGMTLEADILLERRRLIDWVIDPLYAYGNDFRPGSAK